jgi:hypothetical protein
VQSDTRYRELYFVLRNLGTAPAINPSLQARSPAGITVVCVDSPNSEISTQPRSVAPGTLPPIPPLPRGHPLHLTSGDPRTPFSADPDPAFEAKVRVNLRVPKELRLFALELTVTAMGIAPIRYVVECVNPNI